MEIEKIYSHQLFVTPEFKESRWIRSLCEQTPKIWVTRDKVVDSHFTTFFGAINLREDKYRDTDAGPYISDLYLLHELRHVQTLKYDHAWQWWQWHRTVVSSEFEAGLTSECEAYLRIPGLRDKTFSHEIWVDRFGPSRWTDPLTEGVIQDFLTKFRNERRRAMTSPRFDDFCELQVHNYQAQVLEWCRVWAGHVGYGREKNVPAFKVVNRHMEDVAEHTKNDEMDGRHVYWLRRMRPEEPIASHLKPGYNVPFYLQAREFDLAFARSNKQFGNYLLTI